MLDLETQRWALTGGPATISWGGGTVGFEEDRLVERHGERTECWGEVLHWDPPEGFAVTWHPGRGEDEVRPPAEHPAPGIEHEPEPDAGNIMPAENEPGTL